MVYSLCSFTEDIYQMTGYRPGLYWQLTWRYIGPVIMVCILVSSVVFMVIRNPTYGAWNAELVRRKTLLYIFKVLIIVIFLLFSRVSLSRRTIPSGLWA